MCKLQHQLTFLFLMNGYIYDRFFFSQVDGNELTFEFNMSALIVLLKKHAEQNANASYFNVDILKYHVSSVVVNLEKLWENNMNFVIQQNLCFCRLRLNLERAPVLSILLHFGSVKSHKQIFVLTTSTIATLWRHSSQRFPQKLMRQKTPYLLPFFRSVSLLRLMVGLKACSQNLKDNGEQFCRRCCTHRYC